MKIIQIDGFKGLITAAFMGVCLFAGFVIFPGMVAMHLWNKYLVSNLMFPVLNLFQGVLLWAITAISYFILSKKGFAVSFKDAPELSDSELDMIMKKAKIHSHMNKVNKIIQSKDCFEKLKKESNPLSDKNLSHMSSTISRSEEVSAEVKDEESISKL